MLVGKDTRLSGYMFEAALEAGFVAAGVNVMLIGPLPTPGIAYLTKRFECDFGVVISASHNLYDDNGIKFFDAQRRQAVGRDRSAASSSISMSRRSRALPASSAARRASTSRACAIRNSACPRCRAWISTGFKIVIDCANGAGYKVGPRILADLGAEIVPIGCSPNGRNINLNCGSTSPELLQLTVPGVRAQAGIALDGDGDRLVMVDHLGRIVDGDQLLYIIARARQRAEAARRAGRRHRHEQSRSGACAARRRASSSVAPRSAIATCWRC